MLPELNGMSKDDVEAYVENMDAETANKFIGDIFAIIDASNATKDTLTAEKGCTSGIEDLSYANNDKGASIMFVADKSEADLVWIERSFDNEPIIAFNLEGHEASGRCCSLRKH